MRKSQRRGPAATQQTTQSAVAAPASKQSSPAVAAEPLFGVAMLRIAVELKKSTARAVDEVVDDVLAKMGLDEVRFRQYLAQNTGLLKTIAQRRR
jgi:hypothetical protein